MICSYWLASCLAQVGELDRAREVFEHVTAHANDLGLLAEEIDPRDGSLLGNFPQAFSHVGLITAAAQKHPAANVAIWVPRRSSPSVEACVDPVW